MAIKLKGGIKMSRHQNYNKMHKPVNESVSNTEEVTVEATTETEDVSETVNETFDTTGVVIGCLRLNIRSAPNADAHVICTVPVNERLTIHLNRMTEYWHSVTTSDGTRGFCMKQYVDIEG